MTLPITKPVVMPSALAGHDNGKLPDSILRESLTTGGRAILVTPADRAWRALAAAAEDAGHVLVPYSSYRTFDLQRSIFLDRYSLTPKAGVDTKQWNGKTYYKHTGATAAAPGTSNHGRGLALDLRVLVNGEQDRLDHESHPTVQWLIANEARFGFSHEIQSEPWHIRYVTGDHVPAHVLDFEDANPLEDDMTPEQEARILAAIADSKKATIDRTGLVYNQVNTKVGEVINIVRGIDVAASGDADLDALVAAIKELPGDVADELVQRLAS